MAAGLRLNKLQEQDNVQARIRVSWKVRAITSPDGSFVTCVVQDVSDGGARLSVPTGAQLPDRFRLYFPLRDTSVDVAVRWRTDGEIGVAFLDGADTLQQVIHAESEPSRVPDNQRVILERLQLEVAELRSAIYELNEFLRTRSPG